jgi:hypothetical protein
MRQKPYAWFFAEMDGAGTTGCATKEQALEAFDRLFREEAFNRVAKIEDIVETRLYKHKHCDIGTIGSTDCYDCGEPHNSNGRRIFAIHF